MSKGVLLIARNNSEVDYTKQAYYSAKRIKKYLDLPVSLITDNYDYLKKVYTDYESVFDVIIEISNDVGVQYRKYNDGAFVRKTLEYKNTSRSLSYDFSPYDETLLLDTDFIISNDRFKACFDQPHNLLMYKDAFEISGFRDVSEFVTVSETGPDFYWATAVFFRKTATNKLFFDLVKHIQSNWMHYKNLYQLPYATFRNDYAFSIAVHIMNGHKTGNLVKPMPDTMYFSSDRDVLLEIKDESFLILTEKKDSGGKYFPIRIKNSNVHIMNKLSLGRIIDNDN